MTQNYARIAEQYGRELGTFLLSSVEEHTVSAIKELVSHNVLVVLNENDAVHKESTFGDNDKMAATLAKTLGARLTIISDVKGLYDGRERIIHTISTNEAKKHVHTGGSGTGGMMSKIHAAEICGQVIVGCDSLKNAVQNGTLIYDGHQQPYAPTDQSCTTNQHDPPKPSSPL